VLALGILAVGQLFPAGSQGQVRGKMLTSANLYAQQKVEQLRPLSWNDAALSSLGPSSGRQATESLGDHGSCNASTTSSRWLHPCRDLKKITVTVNVDLFRSALRDGHHVREAVAS
jgi:hypothetical protein